MSIPDEEQQAVLDAQIQNMNDLMWRQMYGADVLVALKHDPLATLKPNVAMEFGFYAQNRLGMKAEETGITEDQLKCLFELGTNNKTMYEEKIIGISHEPKPYFSNEQSKWKPLSRSFDECFPTEEVIEVR